MSGEYLDWLSNSLDVLQEQIENVRNLITSAPSDLSLNAAMGNPGCIVPYNLPDEEYPEVLLSPVGTYAIREMKNVGPLNEYQLKNLLSQKFDRRVKRTVAVIQSYTLDVNGVQSQLQNLCNQLRQMMTVENLRNDFLHKRIKAVLTAILNIEKFQSEGEQLNFGNIPRHVEPDGELIEEVFTPSSKLALKETIEGGPLDEKTLKKLLSEWFGNSWTQNLFILQHYTTDIAALKKQLKAFKDYMDSVEDLERFRNNFLLGQISKVLADLEVELYY